MKVEVFRQSGKPVNLEAALEYEEMFKTEYSERYKRVETKEISIDDFKLELDVLDKELAVKFPMFDIVELPKSVKQWKELQMKYEAPITVAIAQETEKLTLFLMDGAY